MVKDGENIVCATLDNQKANITIVTKDLDTVYVSADGDDSNEGSKLSPVKTIAKAIELAVAGKIVILQGNYIENNILINKDLNITGEGNVVIDGNASGVVFTINSGNTVYLKNLNIISFLLLTLTTEIIRPIRIPIMRATAVILIVLSNPLNIIL